MYQFHFVIDDSGWRQWSVCSFHFINCIGVVVTLSYIRRQMHTTAPRRKTNCGRPEFGFDAWLKLKPNLSRNQLQLNAIDHKPFTKLSLSIHPQPLPCLIARRHNFLKLKQYSSDIYRNWCHFNPTTLQTTTMRAGVWENWVFYFNNMSSWKFSFSQSALAFRHKLRMSQLLSRQSPTGVKDTV